jgi:hypothetical protein
MVDPRMVPPDVARGYAVRYSRFNAPQAARSDCNELSAAKTLDDASSRRVRVLRYARVVTRVVLAALFCGCSLGEVPIDDARCPCVAGYRCDVARDRCVRDVGSDGGPSFDAADRDSGPSDAGSTDAGPAIDGGFDAGLDSTGCDDVLAGGLFCDGFEGSDLITGWELDREDMGVTSLVADPVYRGAGAMSASTSAATGVAAVTSTLASAVSEGDLWARAYFYVPSGPALALATVLIFYGDDDGYGAQFRETYGAWMGTPTGRVVSPGGMPVPRDRWFCYELHVVVGAAGSIEVFASGEQVIAMSGIPTLPTGGLHTITAGLEFTVDTQEPLTIYVDEVAAGPTRLPCD